MAGSTALFTTGAPASAATLDNTSISMVGLSMPMVLTCITPCPINISATSTGDISGLDGTNPFTVAWTNAGVGGVINYNSGCDFGVWTGATLVASQAVINGATFKYGANDYSPATVTIHFTGIVEEGMFSPTTNSIDIAGNGGPPITIFVPVGDPGVMPMAPTSVPGSCPSGASSFVANGVFLAVGE